ncbi:hypothetical protein RUND412_002153 [Rhizina undulata]
MSSSKTPYRDDDDKVESARSSIESTSTTSLILERINPSERERDNEYDEDDDDDDVQGEKGAEDFDLEDGRRPLLKPAEKKIRKAIYIIGGLLVGGWLLALAVYMSKEFYSIPDASDSVVEKSGKKITLDQVMGGSWRSTKHDIQWIGGPTGAEDGLLLTQQTGEENWLEVHDVKNDGNKIVLMKSRSIQVGHEPVFVQKVWPSPDLKRVLLASDIQSNWRHSFTARYWIYDVVNTRAVPLIPKDSSARCSLAVWSPKGDVVSFVKENNLFIRRLPEDSVTQITNDGGTELFYGIPDWVYEEEVFSGNTAMWWSTDGEYLAFLRTNETEVPEYPIQYFVSRPSGEHPPPGLENYPELEFIKYPKAGAPNPVVDIRFWDMKKNDVFSVQIKNDLPDDDRLITEVLWAGGKNVLLRETNRESDLLKMVLIDVENRSGKVVREVDVVTLDGGWFEVTQNTEYIPADPEKGRPNDGYIDTVIHEGYDHLAYFTPMDSDKPIILTSGSWEVVDAPSAVDLEHNLVYFVGTERSPIERHVYSVKLDGSEMKPLTNTSVDGRYGVSFSKRAGFALLSYDGPGIPWQRVIGTPSGDVTYIKDIETNAGLKDLADAYELPSFHYSNVTVDGFILQVVERRPPHFDPKLQYPILFYVYGGPGSQMVTKNWQIDFQAYVAASLGYIVVTVDGRGTGFIGRKARVVVRGNLGYWEAHDQIETARIWSEKEYVDEKRIAIWGWSYGGFMTLKTLEQDGGEVFSYGMAVAPVTDWRFYDSIYTERYMHTPQHNPEGYRNATVSDVQALSKSVRFLMMHGVADDNVHMQNSLTLLDKLDLGSVENYDVHVFPDSDHSIYFHNANRMVYDRLETWLVTAFNGEFLKYKDLKPVENGGVDAHYN